MREIGNPGEARSFDAEWRARFERFGATHAEEHAISGWSRDGLRRRARLLEGIVPGLPLPTRGAILELGCGAGTYVRLLAGLGHFVVGADYSLPTLRRALEADPGPNGRYLAAEGYGLPFRAEAFDLIVCIGVLQAVGEPRRLLGEVARLLGPGGVAVIEALNAHEVPARGRRLLELIQRRPSRVRTYRPAMIERWLRQVGLTVARREPILLPPRRLPGIGGVLDLSAVERTVARQPLLAFPLAHAFWYVARRSR